MKMKLKDLTPGMAVHCETEEQAETYCYQLSKTGLDTATSYFPFKKYGSELCYIIDETSWGKITYGGYADLEFAKEECMEVVEFYELDF